METAVIDRAGFRRGVGIVLINRHRQVFFAKRIGMAAWQFPQGGMYRHETPLQTMYRELQEEIGLNATDVTVVTSTERWLCYRLPTYLRRYRDKPLCVGQKQKWFLLRLLHDDDVQFNLNANTDPEFDSWAWVSYWYPLKQVIAFKKRVYAVVLKEFSKFL